MSDCLTALSDPCVSVERLPSETDSLTDSFIHSFIQSLVIYCPVVVVEV